MHLDARPVADIIDGLWLVWVLYWLVNAYGNKKSVYQHSHLPQMLYGVISFGFIYMIVQIRSLRIPVLPHTLATQIIGIVLCAAGIAVAIWARRVLGRNWSGIVTLKQDHTLVRRGPYRFVRHPIYSGLILAAAGTFVALLSTLQGVICVLLLATGLRLKSLHEERILVGQFPDDYPRYRREVKALIPFVY